MIENKQYGRRGHIAVSGEDFARAGELLVAQLQSVGDGFENARAARMNRPGADRFARSCVLLQPAFQPRPQVFVN